jgi:hypothetical protein
VGYIVHTWRLVELRIATNFKPGGWKGDERTNMEKNINTALKKLAYLQGVRMCEVPHIVLSSSMKRGKLLDQQLFKMSATLGG